MAFIAHVPKCATRCMRFNHHRSSPREAQAGVPSGPCVCSRLRRQRFALPSRASSPASGFLVAFVASSMAASSSMAADSPMAGSPRAPMGVEGPGVLEPKPIQVEELVSISGGYLKHPMVPDITSVGKTKFMALNASDNNIAQLLAGRVNLERTRVLSKFGLIHNLRDARDRHIRARLQAVLEERRLDEAEGAGDNKAILALGLDASPRASARAPASVGAAKKKISPAKQAAWTQIEEFFDLEVVAKSPKNPARFTFRVKKDDPKKVVSIEPTADALEFLVHECAFDLEARVARDEGDPRYASPEPSPRHRTMDGSPVCGRTPPSEPARKTKSTCYFITSRNAWMARVTKNGKNSYKSFKVMSPGSEGRKRRAKALAQSWIDSQTQPP